MSAVWLPARFTPPLAEGAPSLFARFAPVFRLAWEAAMGYRLEGWQEWLLEAITEVYPAGHERAGELRFRQVLVSLGRQNGKTELMAALGLLFMLSRAGAYVVGIATSAEQANLVYRRAMRVIRANRALAARFEALTDTRGMRAKDGGQWEIKAAKSAALQGLPIDLGAVDEVHLVKAELWTDLVAGAGGRPNTMVAGITTAGDDDSALLKSLYEAGEKAVSDPGARFGFFCWEAPEAAVPADDEELLAYLRAANPALASGRLDAGNVLSDVRATPEADVIRYRLNRFVSSSNVFIGAGMWAACARGEGEKFPPGRPVFAIDRTNEWGFATVVAAIKDEAGVIHTEVVASVVNPTVESLLRLCEHLAAHSPLAFVVDGYQLRDLGNELKRRGQQVRISSMAELVSASSLLYARVIQRRVKHAGDELLSVQMPRTVRRSIGEGYRISRADSSVWIDGVIATALGVYAAEVTQDTPMQIW